MAIEAIVGARDARRGVVAVAGCQRHSRPGPVRTPPLFRQTAGPVCDRSCRLRPGLPRGVSIQRIDLGFVVANWVLVTSVVGLLSALTLVWLRQLLQTVPISARVADLLTLGFGFGSLLLTYGVTFNNHSVAAGLITEALALTLLDDPQDKRSKRRRLLAGFLAGLTATVDLPAGGVLLVAAHGLAGCPNASVPRGVAGGCVSPFATP